MTGILVATQKDSEYTVAEVVDMRLIRGLRFFSGQSIAQRFPTELEVGVRTIVEPGDFFLAGSMPVVSSKFKALVQLHEAECEFFELQVSSNSGKLSRGDYYCMNILAERDAFDADSSGFALRDGFYTEISSISLVPVNREPRRQSWTSTIQKFPTTTIGFFLHAGSHPCGKLHPMGYARSHLVDPTTPGTFHCVSRCVRRAFLCGFDAVTKQCYEHRRGLLEARIHLLAGQFAVALHAYAVMSNHLHLVIAIDPREPTSWTDAEVVERWRRVFPVKAKAAMTSDDTDPHALTPDQQVEPERIATWRQRLGSLSWFMRALLEPIARKANQEDGCTGRFWEGRFFSQALLDERAILAASAYVDLNPVRAEMAKSLAGSTHTGVARRLAELQASAPTTPPQPEPVMLPPVVGSCRIADCLPIQLAQYLELLAWSGNVPILAGEAGNEATPKAAAGGTASVLRKVLDCDPSEWLAEFNAIRQRWRLVGGSRKVREWLDLRSRRWMRKSKRTLPTARPAVQMPPPF